MPGTCPSRVSLGPWPYLVERCLEMFTFRGDGGRPGFAFPAMTDLARAHIRLWLLGGRLFIRRGRLQYRNRCVLSQAQ